MALSRRKSAMVLKSGPQAAQQPDDLDIAMGLALQPAARSHPVQIAVDIQLQQVARRITRTPRRPRLDPREPCRRKVQPLNQGAKKPDRILDVYVIVDRLRQQQKLVARIR